MKLLLAINNLETGGAESFFCRFAHQLAEMGHQVWIWQLFYPKENHKYVEMLKHENIYEFSIHNNEIQHLCHYPSGIKSWVIRRKVNKKIKELGIQLVNSHLFEADYFISMHIELPQVVSMHGSYEMYYHYPAIFQRDSIFRNLDFHKIVSFVLSKVNHVVLASEKNKIIIDFLAIKVPITKIYYGIEAYNGKQMQKSDLHRLGLLSRGLATKGWRIAIESCQSCRLLYQNDIRLVLGYTSSPYMEQLRQEFGHLEWIEWIQDVEDSVEFFNSIDLLIFPTQYPAESLPNVVIESLNMGVPVFSTSIGEIPLMLDSEMGTAGFLLDYQLEDEILINSFAEAINRVSNDSNWYQQLRMNAICAANKFKLSASAKHYLALFNKVLHEK